MFCLIFTNFTQPRTSLYCLTCPSNCSNHLKERNRPNRTVICPQDDESDEGEDEAAGEKAAAADASAAATGEGASAAASTGEATSNGSEKGPGTNSTGQFSLVKEVYHASFPYRYHEF